MSQCGLCPFLLADKSVWIVSFLLADKHPIVWIISFAVGLWLLSVQKQSEFSFLNLCKGEVRGRLHAFWVGLWGLAAMSRSCAVKCIAVCTVLH